MWRREVANLASPQVNAGPFARAFPAADFYAVDQQYSFPLPLRCQLRSTRQDTHGAPECGQCGQYS